MACRRFGRGMATDRSGMPDRSRDDITISEKTKRWMGKKDPIEKARATLGRFHRRIAEERNARWFAPDRFRKTTSERWYKNK